MKSTQQEEQCVKRKPADRRLVMVALITAYYSLQRQSLSQVFIMK